MFKLFVLGIADPMLSSSQEKILESCTHIVGTKRLLELAAHLPCSAVDISPLNVAIESIRKSLLDGNVAILASGDPLFYGIGRRLLKEFDEDSLEIYPALSSIQRACAKFKIPWDDARLISLHGRSADHLPGMLLSHPKSIVLTDSTNSPESIADRLLSYFQLVGDSEVVDKLEVLVAEDLGLETENIFCGSLRQTMVMKFSPLNILCLLTPDFPATTEYRFGLTENSIHHSRGLITKNEVRAATLHRLQLPTKGILWDIGAGSGSLSIEAARSNPELTVYAVEHKEEELTNIKNNIVKFRCYNIVPVFGRAPELLDQLPDPDRVFIGGSSGSLASIIELVDKRLAKDGRLVINGVIEKTVKTAPELMKRHNFSVSSSNIRFSRTELAGTTQDFNPITIMTGTR